MLAVTESGSAATNSGAGIFVGEGVGVAVRVYVGLADVGEGVADLVFFTGDGLAVASLAGDAAVVLQPASRPTAAIALIDRTVTRPAAVDGADADEPFIVVSVPHKSGHSGQAIGRVWTLRADCWQ